MFKDHFVKVLRMLITPAGGIYKLLRLNAGFLCYNFNKPTLCNVFTGLLSQKSSKLFRPAVL